MQSGERTIPGLFAFRPNPHVDMLKGAPWPQLLLLLGQSGERIMIDLLVDCAIFVPINAGTNNYFQISGKMLQALLTTITWSNDHFRKIVV